MMMEGSEEKIFHKECVTCSRCDQPITGKYYVEDQKMVCQACLEKQVSQVRKIFFNSFHIDNSTNLCV